MSANDHELVATAPARFATHAVKKRKRRAPAVPIDKALPKIRAKWDAFEGSMRKSVERAIALGKTLIDEKAKLPHGEFGKLFVDHKEPVEGALPFTQNWSNKLMRLAANPVISNCDHDHNLPADLNTVYELAAIPAPDLQQAIESGDVRPTMTRDDAKALRREVAGEPAAPSAPREKPTKPKRDVLDDCAHRIEEAIADAILSYPDLRPAIAARIELIHQGIKR